MASSSIGLGAIWHEVRLPSPAASVVFWITLYGTYGNWLFTTLAAVFGTAALSPITGAGHSGLPWQESLVTIGFLTVGITMVLSSVAVLWVSAPERCHEFSRFFAGQSPHHLAWSIPPLNSS